MKARNVFALLGLTFAMGAGVFAGVASKKAEEVGAYSGEDLGKTWYIVGTINGQNWDNWNSFTLNESAGRYEYEFDDVSPVEFKLKNVQSWEGGIEINANYGEDFPWSAKGWSALTNNNGGNFQTKEAGKYIVYYDKNILEYENGCWAFGIEKAKVDPSPTKNSFYIFDELKVFGNDVTKINVYGYDPDGVVKDMVWPGENDVETATLGGVSMYTAELSESYAGLVVNNGDGNNQTIDITDADKHAGEVLRIGSETGSGSKTYNAFWQPATDFTDRPEHDGYYLVGTKTSWAIAGAPELGAGDDLNYAKLVRYNASDAEKFKVVEYSDYTKIWHSAADGDEDGNCVVSGAGLVNIFLSKGDGQVYLEEKVPAADGYYIYGSEIGWEDYDPTYKMTNTSQDGNLAFFMNYEAKVNEYIRVRSYYTDRFPYEQRSSYGGDPVTDYGVQAEDNFKFTKAGHYDIYARMVDESFRFFVAEHVDSFTFERTAVKFTGATKTGTEALENETAYAGNDYEPTKDTISGYVTREVYTDENCTIPYVPAEPTADGHVYIKYTKVGFYTISLAGGWSIDAAVEMNTSGINPSNKAETIVVVSAANECYSFVYYDGGMYGQDGLGETYSFATYEDGHVKFTKAGTYAVYFNSESNLIYLNEGKIAFFTNFLSETGGVCKTDDTTDLEALGTIWEAQANVYKTLPQADKDYIVDTIGFDGGDEKSEDLGKQFMARYHYIVTKYGTAAFNDFIFNQNIGVSRGVLNNSTASSVDNTALIAIISVITLVSVSSIAVLLVIKKRKHN